MNFKVTKEQAELIAKIAHRAHVELFKDSGVDQTVLDTTMDLTATVANGCPLRLDALLTADSMNFAHDVGGIRRHIDRSTGELKNCFLPRFYDSGVGSA